MKNIAPTCAGRGYMLCPSRTVLVIMVIITLHLMTMITILPPRCWERVGLVTMMALFATLSKETGVMSLPIVVSSQPLSFFAILLFPYRSKVTKE